tara:strand:- start:1730 stop:1906 length:177 start_codon:yes stop_codon:yes gene_type:complete
MEIGLKLNSLLCGVTDMSCAVIVVAKSDQSFLIIILSTIAFRAEKAASQFVKAKGVIF